MIKVDWVIISGVFKRVYCLFITRNWSFCAAVFNIYGFSSFSYCVCLPV